MVSAFHTHMHGKMWPLAREVKVATRLVHRALEVTVVNTLPHRLEELTHLAAVQKPAAVCIHRRPYLLQPPHLELLAELLPDPTGINSVYSSDLHHHVGSVCGL